MLLYYLTAAAAELEVFYYWQLTRELSQLMPVVADHSLHFSSLHHVLFLVWKQLAFYCLLLLP